MKKLLVLFLLFSVHLYSQSDETVIYGKIEKKHSNVELESFVGLRIRYFTTDNYYYTNASVNKDGFYYRSLPKKTRVIITTNYQYYCSDTIEVQTGLRDSIRVDFELKRKQYKYTQLKAIQDFEKGLVQLITFDTLEYEWSRKVDLKKIFGFDYLLLKKPEDDDFKEKMDDYNRQMESYIERKKPDWKNSLAIVRDSVINAEADEYGKNHIIAIKGLKVPEKEKLSERMKKNLDELLPPVEYYKALESISKKDMLDIIINEKDFKKLSAVSDRLWLDYTVMLPDLIVLITNEKEVGLENFNGLMHTSKGLSGYVPTQTGIAVPYSTDDLTIVAGRANYLLKKITDEDFGDVDHNPNKEYLKKLQNRWAYWLLQMQ